MQIQKINPFLNYNFKQTVKITKKEEPIEEQPQYSSMPSSLAFGARVDKGLSRFYEVNADKMPSTVKKFIENLPSKEIFTPLAAQAAAFAGLAGALTIADIKNSYPEEELFQNLISPDDSKATRGILGTYRENKDLLEMCDQGILENKETPAGLPNKSRSIRCAFKPVWVGIRVRRMRESLVASANNRSISSFVPPYPSFKLSSIV